MHICNIPEKRLEEHFSNFMANSEFTLEGIDLESRRDKIDFCKEFEKIAKDLGYEGPELIGYYYHGKDMNEAFGLIENNMYPENLGFLTIEGLHSGEFKVMCGARWFDDICFNNAIKQNAILFGHEPDFDCLRDKNGENRNN